jgi:hypothetical protein
MEDLYLAGLIRLSLRYGCFHGYCYEIYWDNTSTPRRFELTAVPTSYNVTGQRSFYLGMDGVMRGADRQGNRANANDPPIND